MLGILKLNPLARAVMVVAAVAVLVTGTTLAALSTTATTTGNTLATTTADLEVAVRDGSSEHYPFGGWGEFGDSVQGFQVTEIVPGEGSEKYWFRLNNTGGVDLNVTVKIPNAPSVSAGVDLSKVKVTFGRWFDCDQTKTYTFTQLLAGPKALPCNPLEADPDTPPEYRTYWATFDIAPADLEGDQAKVNGFKFVFEGTHDL